MSTVTIGVVSFGYTQRRTSAALRQGARISFASEDLLWKTLTPKWWAKSARSTAASVFRFGQAVSSPRFSRLIVRHRV